MGLVLQLWFVFAAFVVSAGWILSLFHALNVFGYLCAFLVFAVIAAFWVKPDLKRRFYRSAWVKPRRRFSRAAPLCYLIVAAIAIIGGVIHYPTHFGAFSYGIPRVLHWLAEGRWHWIRSADVRLNVVAANFEWLITPFLAFTKTERGLFLINAFSFLLLPGALFMLFHQVGMKRKTAWWWMWILPAAYCYSMQAGGLGTDGYVAVFSVGSVGLALRAGRTGSLRDLWASILAMAFVTGAKQSNVALFLPWFVAIRPSLKNLWQQPIVSGAFGLLALGASILPITISNLAHDCHWSGFGPGHDGAPENAFWGIVGNSLWITTGNLLPPIFPWADKWNATRLSFLHSDLGRHFRSFESFFFAPRAAAELYSGLGMTISILLLVSALAGRGSRESGGLNAKAVRWSAWLALLIFMAKVGINQDIRYLAPYYPLLIPSFLLGARQVNITKTHWWRFLAFATMLSTAGLLIISRQRPVFPVKTLTRFLENHGGGKFSVKIVNSYTFIEQLRYDLSPLLAKVPPSERQIGFMVRLSDKEPALWKPFGSRKVVRFAPEDTPDVLRSFGIRYIMLDATTWGPPDGLMDQTSSMYENPSSWKKLTIDEWLQMYNAEVLGKFESRPLPDAPPEPLYLVRLREKS